MMMTVTYKKDSEDKEYSRVKDFIISNNFNSADGYVDLTNNNSWLCRLEDIVVEAEFVDAERKIIYHSLYDIVYPDDFTIDFRQIDESRYEDIFDIIQSHADAWYHMKRGNIFVGI